MDEAYNPEGANFEERFTEKPDLDRVVAVTTNLANVLASSNDTPNRQQDIEARRNTLERMGVDMSWYSDTTLTSELEEQPWYQVVSEAQRMTDPNDRDYGKYVKARDHSGIVGTLKDFEERIDFNSPINDGRNEWPLYSLRQAAKKFQSRKDLSDSFMQSFRSAI
ncbi:hypothetical protein A2955_04215 [Candidatus Woesebacteria bacterium RIFCSPLOWO2_01_FULL_37_19]|uniref:Uncharacterized protein n=1 Tax=Candidatus Woesebacteria bacterium RIFCSPLOWO2_01_FULL_37_19 TaxID=1802514 RepID=A0A1F8B0K0_9BACT|nr:MAG: hypothetical protein A2955_04215 [Candidatus Woesebacteria bacterium RIFCSPLOWO2_01_FULL_37_19]